MFGISLEHLLIVAVVLLFFGPRRLPEAAAALGKAVRNFRDQYKGIHEPEYRRLADETSPAPAPEPKARANL